MIVGLVSQELYQQLLDPTNYQNRTDGVEDLKRTLSEVDLNPIPPESIQDFLHLLTRLLDDSNFKVFYGTLQVLNILVRRLDAGVQDYVKQIVFLSAKALGDTRTIARNEYMDTFRLVMKTVSPQQVLDLIICNLKHKNSRVREDVLHIIIAAMLIYPRKEFDIPKLCLEVAPNLADGKRKVRHAALELFALFDSCLDSGKKQPIAKALDAVRIGEDLDGLVAAVLARQARCVLPRLSPEGVVEYGLAVGKTGTRWSPRDGFSGADLDWVMNGGRGGSARSLRTEPDGERLHGYGSLGSLADSGLRSQRRIVSAGKGKNKLPWETLGCSANENDRCRSLNGKSSERATSDEMISPSRKLSPETYIPTFSSAEPQTPQTSRRRIAPARIRRSGSLNLDPDVFKTTNFTDPDSVLSKGHLLSRNPSVERTLSLPANPSTTPGSFLLPSYPLAALPGGTATPTLSRRHADSSLSMSNTWPNKRDASPRRDATLRGDPSSRYSPRPIGASLRISSSASSFRRALTTGRTAMSVSPVVPAAEFYTGDQNPDPRINPQNQNQERDAQLEAEYSDTTQDPQEDVLDMEEMLNSLRSLRNSAAKKRAKVSLGGSEADQESPDSTLRSSLGQDLPWYTSPILPSSTSESGFSSLSPTTSSVFGIKSSGSMTSPRVKPRIPRVSYAKLKSSVSMDLSALAGLSQCDELSPEVGVVGQRVTYANGKIPGGEDAAVASPPLVKPLFRVNQSTKGCGNSGSGISPTTDVPEGVVGRGVFGSSASSLRSDLTRSLDHGDSADKASADPSGGLPVISGDHRVPDDPTLDEEKIRHRVRQMLCDSPHEDNVEKILHWNGGTIPPRVEDLTSDGSPISPSSSISPPGLQSPVKCRTPIHQPSPPTVPPNPQNLSRMRRAPSLNRTRPSLSHSSEELSPDTLNHKKNVSQLPELSAFSKPDLALMQSFDLLSSTDWDKKIKGLTLLRSLAHFHGDTLQGRIRDVCLSLIEEVKNLRSGVARAAVCTLGDLYTHLEKAMDQELDATVKALLLKAGGKDVFIRHDIDAALDAMVRHCAPTRAAHALLSGGLGHRSGLVRKCTAQHLANLVEKVGGARLLSGGKDLAEKIIPAVTKLSQDSSQEARYYGRRMLLLLSAHPDFEKILERTISSKYLQTTRDTILTIKTKGLGEIPQDIQSPRGRRSLPGSGTFRALSLTREPLNQTVRTSNSNYSNRSQPLNVGDKNKYIKHITGLLASKDFRERIKGMDRLVADCQQNPNVVIHNVFPVFDALQARLQESNPKINQYALESLQKIIPLIKDNLSQVVNILIPAIVDNHLNSKNNAIYSAATKSINALISNLDNGLLLQPFCTKAQFINGKAKVDLVEKVADLVNELYPRKPQLVEQKALPLLWHLLGASGHGGGAVHGGGSVRGATAILCRALFAHMGAGLSEHAAAQSAGVHKGLNELLRGTAAKR
ncbi:TOG array regulator of axonemal microtubules protein 1 [Stigmatopora argus]